MVVTRHNLAVNISGSGMLATSATLNIASNSVSRRVLQADPSWAHAGPLTVGLSLKGYFSENWSWLFNNATGESASGFSVQIGSVILTHCYLEEFEIRGNSHGPLEVAANIRSWSPPSGSFDLNSGSQSSGIENVYHAQTSEFNYTGGVVYPDNFVYKVQTERVPRFLVGSSVPTNVRLARVEKELSLQGRNVSSFVSYSGSTGAANFNLNYTTGTGSNFNVYISGEIADQDFTVGDLLDASITIKQFLR